MMINKNENESLNLTLEQIASNHNRKAMSAQNNSDDLLNQIEQQFKQKKVSNYPQNKTKNEDSLDHIIEDLSKKKSANEESSDLLSDIENKFKQNQPTSKQKNNDNLLSEIENKYQRQSQKSSFVEENLNNISQKVAQKVAQKQKKTKITEKSFEEIKREELAKQRQAKAEAKRQEEEAKITAQKREQLKQKAEKWLKNLDPTSDEGFWFSQFAMSYDSPLQAAIEYLQVMG
ncbi:MAG: hypothetical protein IGQ45_05925 [Cyanobacterium sp. T60_A2020_053]|nr:hypothetical protein [Cyanobacterium sp. T60_A2020_053]